MGLDGVELVMAVEESFDISISDSEACELITPALLIDHVQRSIKSLPDRKPCISLRAFHQIRASLAKTTSTKRSDIRLRTQIKMLFRKPVRHELWSAFRIDCSLLHLPDLKRGRGVIFSPTRVSDLVSAMIHQRSGELTKQGEWTDQEVRQMIRVIIQEQLGIKKFSDDDEFVRDLGVD